MDLAPAMLLLTTSALPPQLSAAPQSKLDQLCQQMSYAATWLAQRPDDIDAFVQRYLEHGTRHEQILADVAVREAVGALSFHTGIPASVERECEKLRGETRA